MKPSERARLSSGLLRRARELGADKAGIARMDRVMESPSHALLSPPGRPGDSPLWPPEGKSVVVVGLSHPEDSPALDWWIGQSHPRGNQLLVETVDRLEEWARDQHEDLQTYHMPYHVEKGGIFLKDAAAIAGLGCIGLNNLLITPEFGPRIRLRAMMVNQHLIPTGPTLFNPCFSCAGYCLRACPQGAFSQGSRPPEDMDHPHAGMGGYSRRECSRQMESDEKRGAEREGQKGEGSRIIKYCRMCELACVVGAQGDSGGVGV